MSVVEPVVAGRFTLGPCIGEGGMGRVFEARDRETGSLFALKIVDPQLRENQDTQRRFAREREVAERVIHQNIMRVIELITTDTHGACLVMEHLAGEDLHAYLTNHRIVEPRRAIEIAKQVAEGLDAAHRAGVVHSDLKPSNIFLVNEGGDKFSIKILDFGIAQFLGEPLPEAPMGTATYSSPERLLRQNADARADVWSLGAILYEMVSGQSPFATTSAAESWRMIVNTGARPLAEVAPWVPSNLAALIEKSLQIDPAARIASSREMIDRLSDETLVSFSGENTTKNVPVYLSRRVRKTPASSGGVPKKVRSKNHLLYWILSLAVACALLGWLVFLWATHRH